MHRRLLPALAATSLAFATLGASGARSEEYRVSGPVTHENLAIYLIHGPSAAVLISMAERNVLASLVSLTEGRA